MLAHALLLGVPPAACTAWEAPIPPLTGWPETTVDVTEATKAALGEWEGLWVDTADATCERFGDVVVAYAAADFPFDNGLQWDLVRMTVDVVCSDCEQPFEVVEADVDWPYGESTHGLTWALPIVASKDTANGSPWACDPSGVGYQFARGTWRHIGGLFARSCTANGYFEDHDDVYWPEYQCQGEIFDL